MKISGAETWPAVVNDPHSDPEFLENPLAATHKEESRRESALREGERQLHLIFAKALTLHSLHASAGYTGTASLILMRLKNVVDQFENLAVGRSAVHEIVLPTEDPDEIFFSGARTDR